MSTLPEIKTIVYATDLGRRTSPVFRHALVQAANNNAKIVILHVVEPMTETASNVIKTYLSKEEVEEVQRDGMKKVLTYVKERIDRFLQREGEGKSLSTEPIEEILVVSGRPSEEILRVAEDHHADMIVMGKSSRKIRGNKVVGSTVKRVTRLSPIPVLVVANQPAD